MDERNRFETHFRGGLAKGGLFVTGLLSVTLPK